MRKLQSIARVFTVAGLLLWQAVDMLLRPVRNSREGAQRMHEFCKKILRALGINWNATGEVPQSGVVVSNHLSYLDILLFSAHSPFVMVAKSEVRAWPLIGWLTRQAGTVYVVRGGGPATFAAVNEAMAEAFRSGLPVLFFPEGTTTDGSTVLPFKRGLFHSVLNENVSLHIAAVRYSDASACWWGDDVLLPHILKMAAMKDLRAELRFGPEIRQRRDRFELTVAAREQIAQLRTELCPQQVSLAHHHEDLLDGPVEGLSAFDGHGCVLR